MIIYLEGKHTQPATEVTKAKGEKMRNVKTVIKATQEGRTPLYYNPTTDTVFTKPGAGRYHLTDLLRPHTEDQIRQTVKHFMAY